MELEKAKYLAVSAGVRYWEDGSVDGVEDTDGSLMPFGGGDYWDIKIDIETGFIVDWPIGVTANTYYKVCDDGCYELKDENDQTLAMIEGYVLPCLCPDADGYGDYIIMHIDNIGRIRGWDKSQCIEDFK